MITVCGNCYRTESAVWECISRQGVVPSGSVKEATYVLRHPVNHHLTESALFAHFSTESVNFVKPVQEEVSPRFVYKCSSTHVWAPYRYGMESELSPA